MINNISLQSQSFVTVPPKQRGIYSEMINPQNTKALQESNTSGPDTSYLFQLTQKQRIPKAIQLNTSLHGTQRLKSSHAQKRNLDQSMNRSFYKKLPPKQESETDLTVDPKVLEPYDTIPGKVPRKVAIDRKKKEYASFFIEDLLMHEDIDFNMPDSECDWLDLELFDDLTFDDYENSEWIAKKIDEESQARILRGKALFRDENGVFYWKDFIVDSYNSKIQKFVGRWKDTQKPDQVSRIHICFEAEDPRKFAKRIANSSEQRRICNAIIRYNHYIDNMPLQDLGDLDTEQKKRLENLSKTNKLEQVETTGLIVEVNNDYQRTMNKIIFDHFLRENRDDSEEFYPKSLNLVPLDTEYNQKEVAYYGMQPLERHKGAKMQWMFDQKEIFQEDAKDFNETFKDFCFSSLFIKEEVIKAFQDIKHECNKILDMNVYNTSIQNCMVLEEFKHIQESSISQILYYLKGQWISELVRIVKFNFSGVGKGWFNMKETSKITYNFGKLKRFLTVVRLMMQDTVQSVIKKSFHDYYAFLVSQIPSKTNIISPSQIVNIYFNKNYQKPLFIIDLGKTQNDTEFIYNVKPENFVNMLVQTYEKCLEEIAKIPDLEPKILAELYKSLKNETFIKAPAKPREKPLEPNPNDRPRKYPDENKWIWDMVEDVRNRFREAIKISDQYLAIFNKEFLEILKINPDKYVTDLENSEQGWEIDEMQRNINKIRAQEKALKENLPETMHAGIFQLNLKEIVNYLCDKYRTLWRNLVEMIARKARSTNQLIFNEFAKIQNRIKDVPKQIEKLCELRDFMLGVPNELQRLKLEMVKNFKIYEALEIFSFRFSKEDLDKRWFVFGSPKETLDLIEKREKDLEKDKMKFFEEMKVQQEEFKENIDNLERTIMNFHQYQDIKAHEEVSKVAQDVNKQLADLISESRKFNSRENLFEVEQTNYDKIQQIQKEFQPFSTLWITCDKWCQNFESWHNDPFDQLDAVEAERFVEEGSRNMAGVCRFFKERDIEPVLKIATIVKSEIEEFKPKVPLLVALRKPGMKGRHWQNITDAVGFRVFPDDGFTFQKALDMDLLKHVELCVDVGEKAYKEHQIEVMLAQMHSQWETISFSIMKYKTSSIMKQYDEIQQVLDEHIVNTQAMQFSPFKKPYEDQIIEWNDTLKIMSNVLEEWAKCQQQWMYLQPIFDSADIAKQLPTETKKFRTVDSTWKHTMNQAITLVNVLKVCSQDGLYERLQEANKNLETIQKELNSYLEKKRDTFARFFFLSNDDLLEILSQTKEPTAVQPHLKKVFENIHEIEFDSGKKINAMYSAEREKVAFIKQVDPNLKNVEDWMGEVEEMMKSSVRHALMEAFKDYSKQLRTKWVLSHPGQCILNGSQIIWTAEVEEAFEQDISMYKLKMIAQLDELVELVRKPLTKQQSVTLNALIVLDVHAKDVVERLALGNINDRFSFEWISQLRYYIEQYNCIVKCIQTEFQYGYEYLGNTLRLVITPLTDKCYMTLMGALKLNLGGAPSGPAGTGKTESVKDLAKALAKQCVVFNCSDSMDYLMVGKFFKGLASAGAWCCFDEFNRINIEVLSVIAQQLLILFGEKAKGTPQIEFEGSLIKILPTFCVFITMNPGYAGRTELPDNLKALFRSVAMMVPDYAMIGEIMLYSFGFKKGRDLARKMVATFKLSSEQLSSQDHYDYGMRAVRSVINAAGLLKGQNPDMEEEQLLLRALRDVNVPKFLKDDLPLFENIMLDLFPGVSKPQVNYGQLINTLQSQCHEMGLQPIQQFINKILQLYDTIQVRHGLMIVGPTGGGKTSNYKILQKSLSHLGTTNGFYKINTHILNPKSIIMGQLYGQFNEQTHEWTDGILAFRVRECCRDESPEKHWVMFDGPVDALWIESMNTVLDDNKKLCLNSGQILTLTPHMTMMFEVEDLLVASPATVSRCGMIYMEPESLGYQPLVDTWMQKLPSNVSAFKTIKSQLQHLFNEFLQPSLEFVKRQLKEPVATNNNMLTKNLLKLIDCYVQQYQETELKKVSTEQLDSLEMNVKGIFLFCHVWSIGSTTDYDGRLKFNKMFLDLLKKQNSRFKFAENASVYDFEYNEESSTFKNWSLRNKGFQIDNRLQFHEVMIPTTDSTRIIYLLKLLISNNFHVLTPGLTGTGKSVNIANLLTTQLSEESFQYISISFSAQTSANQTQDTIDSKMDKRRKGIFGPPIGKKFIIFIDDLNMPKKEEYGAQPPIELIRQFMDHSGWYNRKDLLFMKIEDLLFLSAMGPPGGGRSIITSRLVRQFSMINYTELDQDTISQIFSTLSSNFLKKYSEIIRNIIPTLVSSVLHIYNTIRQELLPTPSKSHYTFNLRDIWKVFQGICSGTPQYTGEKEQILRLWFHENMRVFHDRLTTTQDRIYLQDLLKSQLIKFEVRSEEILDQERILFTDILQGREQEIKYYQQVSDMTQLINKMDDYQESFNSDNTFILGGSKKPMKLVMFLDACEHITRISRIIRQPQGNALLLGVGGSGRQSLSRFATFLGNYKLFQIEVIKNYTTRSWREDIKKVLLYSGLENKPVCFLFCDTQIIRESMMEDINNILNSADVTGIYQDKEMDDIVQVCKTECIRRNIQPTKINIFNQYLNRVRKNIHLILAMSPLGSAFTTRLRMFPSLVNCCTIDWFTEWPDEALLGVGIGQLEEYAERLDIQQNLQKFVQMFKNIHKSVERISIQFTQELRRYNYVTPTSFLELISLFKQILFERKQDVAKSINRLKIGLDKLEDANVQVNEMKIILNEMKPKLEQASLETEIMMQKLSKDKADADEDQKVVAKQEVEATKQEQAARQLAAEAEAQVADANRELEKTLAEVSKLKKEHLGEIKTLSSPPRAVTVTLAGLVILNTEKIKKNGGDIIMTMKEGQVGGKKEENYLETAKKYLLNDTKELLELLQFYDKDNISPATMKKLEEKVLNQPEFTSAAVDRGNYATKFLYMWVKAMTDYYNVFTKTKPLRDRKIEMTKLAEEKALELKIKKMELEQVKQRIQELEELFEEKNRQKDELTTKITECQIKLERAQKLTEGLSDEKTRWAQDIQKFIQRSKLVPSHSVISAGMVAYAGPFTAQFRHLLEKDWISALSSLDLPYEEGITMRSFLGEPVKIQQWNLFGLPKDDTSTENGIIIDKGRRWSLMIDPQTQANKFIKNLGKEHQEGIEFVKANDLNLMKIMELSVQFGRWVLLENISGDLDPSLEPILLQQVVKQGSSLSIVIGEKTLTYSDKFKLFMTTTTPNPHYPPETFVKVTIINFAITPSGLEEQMLAQIVALENPNLQQKKNDIMKKNAADQKELLNIEDSILQSLSETGGIEDILKDETLINKLQTSKKFATEINQRVKDSRITEAQIDEARESYRPVAFRASLLFFCIVDLSTIDPMYQYSLQFFINLFTMGVENAPASNILEERMQHLNNYFTYSLYENICRSLFERHKILFSFMLTIKILSGSNLIDQNEWRYFLTGPQGEIQIPPNPTAYIADSSWVDIYKQLYGTKNLPAFEGFCQYFMQNSDFFKEMFDSPNAHKIELPGRWNKQLDALQRMIVIKSLRSDKVIPAIQNFITAKLGKQYILVPVFDLNKCYKDSSIITPLIFVLSPGSDPVADFLKFAEDMSMSRRVDSISLGQGQGPKAEKLIKECTQKGGWVLLQNCHLAQSWMTDFERMCEELNESMHRDFRLWCTSMPSTYFPISVLQNGIKMTMEPPQGLRSNLLRTYKNLSDSELGDCTKQEAFKKLLFGFCLFHAIIQDRRKFGAIGWNISYEFTNEDLNVCKRQLKMLLDDYRDIPFKVLNFLGAEINYGGRVTDDKDLRLIKTILATYINPEMLRDGHKFSASGIYNSVPAQTLEDYLTYIDKLPLNPSPEAFGLHDNAEITNAQNETFSLLETILSIQPRSSSNTGKSRETIIEELAIYVEQRTPDLFKVDEIYEVYPTSYKESMNTVLLQEVLRYNKLIQIMKETLAVLKKALKGLVVLSEEMEKLANSLFDNQVPKMWAEKGFLSLKPLNSWTQDLLARIAFLQEWIKNGTPVVFWISGLFFPQAFITGILQNYARKYKIAVDRISFDFIIKTEITPAQITGKPDEGCFIYGLFLEGSKWNSAKSIIVQPKPKELYSEMNIIHLSPQYDREQPQEGVYICPLYKVVSRAGTLSTTGHSTNFVMNIELPSKESQDVWIKAGVAAFLSLRY